MDRRQAGRLTGRQREVLRGLTELFADGFAHLTMADLAAAMNCSLSTLYGMAPSRDALVLTVVDANLRRIGRAASAAVVTDSPTALGALRRYLAAANVAVASTSHEFARDMEAVPGGAELKAAHSDHLVAVTRELLDLAAEWGEIEPVDTAVAARVVAGLGREFAHPDVIGTIESSPRDAADFMVDVIIRGLAVAGSR